MRTLRLPYRLITRLALIASAAAIAILVPPTRALAQPEGKRARIGFLSNFSPDSGKEVVSCFREGLRKSNLVEGRNISIEYRWAEGITSRFPVLAQELVRLNPDVIVVNSTPATQAVKRATGTIPVVFISVSDPVASGLVASLARPGGNVTGVSNFLPETSGKLLEFLRLASSRLSRVCVLHNPGNPGKLIELKELREAARAMNLAIEPLEVRAAGDFDAAFARAAQSRCDALIALQEGITLGSRKAIAEFARQRRMPTIFQTGQFVEAGGLMSYGLHYCQHFEQAASYVSKILGGAKPAELPVELPTRFELIVNRKTADAIGLALPASILIQADRIIEYPPGAHYKSSSRRGTH